MGWLEVAREVGVGDRGMRFDLSCKWRHGSIQVGEGLEVFLFWLVGCRETLDHWVA